MAREAPTISFEEFSSNLEEFFDRVIHEHETIMVEKEEGEVVVLKPALSKERRRKRRTSEADHQAFLASAGSWRDLDLDKFLENLYESRRMSSRPPVEL